MARRSLARTLVAAVVLIAAVAAVVGGRQPGGPPEVHDPLVRFRHPVDVELRLVDGDEVLAVERLGEVRVGGLRAIQRGTELDLGVDVGVVPGVPVADHRALVAGLLRRPARRVGRAVVLAGDPPARAPLDETGVVVHIEVDLGDGLRLVVEPQVG